MDIRKYELFADVAETGNLTRSADRMGYTQSGVSHLLKSLEDEIGFPLFIRSKRGVTLTENGKYLLPLVRGLLSSNQKIEETINSINGFEIGKINIGTFTSISIHWLPEIIYEFGKKYPQIVINIKEGGTDEIESWIDDNTIDIGFLSERHIGQMEFIPLFEDPLTAILPLDHPYAMLDAVPVSTFDKQPFVMSTIGTDYDIHHALSDSDITPTIKYSCTDDHAIVAMVAAKLGVSILPELIAKDYTSSVTVKRLDPHYTRMLGIGYKSKEFLTPGCKKFLAFSREYVMEHFIK